MTVAVKNNSLVQCLALIGGIETGAIVSALISYLPIELVIGGVDDLLISVTYGDRRVAIETRLPEERGYFATILLSSNAAKYQGILESRAIILGLVLLVFNIMPTQTEPPFMFKEVREATSLGSLFDWEERPDSKTNQYYFGDMARDYLSIIEKRLSFIGSSGPTILDGQAPEIDPNNEYDLETIHQRMLNI